MWYDAIGGRKAFMAMLVLVLFTVGLYLGRIESSDYINGSVWVIGLFSGGNGVEHYSKVQAKKNSND